MDSLDYLLKNVGNYTVLNLGTGKSYSVFEVIEAFEEVSGIKIPYEICQRRPGDIAECFTDPSKAKEIIGWKSIHDIKRMCEDSWRWQKNNPNGYNK